MRKGLTAAVGTTLAVALLITAPVAGARHGADGGGGRGGDDSAARASGSGNDRDVLVAGTCTLRSSAKLKLSPEDGGVEVEFEVDENRVGKTWGVTMGRNGTRVVSRRATTNARSGSFEVRAVVGAGSPRTRITAVARRAATGEVCRATATL